MNDMAEMLADSAERLFGAEVSRNLQEAAEAGGWQAGLWQAVSDSGLQNLLVPEEAGGAGLAWAEAMPVLLAAQRHLPPVPFLEGVACAWMLHRVPDSRSAFGAVPADAVWTLGDAGGLAVLGDGCSGNVSLPWGRHAARALLWSEDAGWLLVDLAGASVDVRANIAGEPRDVLGLREARILARVPGLPGESAQVVGAQLRAIAIQAALERVLDQCVTYANERVQFGRPIGRFQAIQHLVAQVANHVVASRMAVAQACEAAGTAVWDEAVAVAKVTASRAAGEVAAMAHQVHGAMGFTYEHSLHFATRRLWSWRAECGGEAQWARWLGERAILRGGAAHWEHLTGVSG
ncbi:acyl-CoA dehydrogenase [Verticiella sediminum]|uniref:Acyl-CoA dehydrogenase n=1 Tax=Verticiella sediminum TaxID=1247510 RepID=A0A556B1K3_9BURK|nr:acyl-CoA dehydrogenase [Verticiella sediminum]TSH98615.1 acyl-CoA dehydrogenase [Verticiella sediminum]